MLWIGKATRNVINVGVASCYFYIPSGDWKIGRMMAEGIGQDEVDLFDVSDEEARLRVNGFRNMKP